MINNRKLAYVTFSILLSYNPYNKKLTSESQDNK